MQDYVVHLIPEKCIFPTAIKARQCLEFELHFHLNQTLPPSTKLFVFAGIFIFCFVVDIDRYDFRLA